MRNPPPTTGQTHTRSSSLDRTYSQLAVDRAAHADGDLVRGSSDRSGADTALARDGGDPPHPESVVLEMSLIHALAATRDLARRQDGDVWRRLEDRTSGLLARTHTTDPETDTGTAPRLERTELTADDSDAVMAALLAVGEAPDEQRAAAALERLDALDGGDGRDDEPQPPERDPALTDEGW